MLVLLYTLVLCMHSFPVLLWPLHFQCKIVVVALLKKLSAEIINKYQCERISKWVYVSNSATLVPMLIRGVASR